MEDLLKKLFPQLSLVELAVRAIGVLLVVGLAAWAVLAVKGWHDDSLALPGVKQQLADKARAYDDLVGRMAGTLEGIPGRLDAIDAWRAALDGRITTNQLDIKGQVDALLRRFPDAFKINPACPEPADVRGGLLQLFPLYRPDAGTADQGRSEGGRQAEPSGPAAAPAAVPRRNRSAAFEGEMGMPTATGRASGDASGVAAGTGRAPDSSAADRNRPAVPAAPGAVVRGWFASAGAAIARAMNLAAGAAVETAQDDRRDGR